MATSAERAPRRPVVLTIAGSDNSAGAGLQADLKTFTALGCYGLTAVTCVVAEVPGKVSGIQPVRAELVRTQIALSLEAFPVRAAKTGLLFSAAIVEMVAATLAAAGKMPLVVDPVMAATSGDALLKPSAVKAYTKALFPLASVVTPNLDELNILTGKNIRTLREMKDAGQGLVDQFGCAFLLKGGHLKGAAAIDILLSPTSVESFEARFVRNVQTHGTGCTYSAAIAAGLAQGESLSKAVSSAKAYVTAAIERSLRWGSVHALNPEPYRL